MPVSAGIDALKRRVLVHAVDDLILSHRAREYPGAAGL